MYVVYAYLRKENFATSHNDFYEFTQTVHLRRRNIFQQVMAKIKYSILESSVKVYKIYLAFLFPRNICYEERPKLVYNFNQIFP